MKAAQKTRLAELATMKALVIKAKDAYREEFGMTDGEKLEVAIDALGKIAATSLGDVQHEAIETLKAIR